jgi:molybdopterin synthase catalytic subunit
VTSSHCCPRLPVVSVRGWITTEPIGAHSVLPLVESEQYGAALVFLGVVRNHNEGRAVTGVYYEAYREMAERTLKEIVEEAARRVEPASIAAVHRLGELAVGNVSIAIAVSTPHRAEAFDACRYVIEEVKQRLAVWKQERYTSGESDWLAGSIPPIRETAQ